MSIAGHPADTAARARRIIRTSIIGIAANVLLARSKLAAKNNVIPIEVKCGSRLSHKSLDKFMNRYAEWLSPPYLLSTHDVKVEGGIVFLPLYMSGLLAS